MRFILLLTLMAVACPANAGEARLELHGGLSLARGEYDAAGVIPGADQWPDEFRYAPSFGAGVHLSTSARSFLRMGFDYFPAGGVSDTGGGSNVSWNLNYLAIPVSIGRSFGAASGIYARGGGSLALAVSRRLEYDGDTSMKADGPGYDLGPLLAVGFSGLGHDRLSIEVEGYWGLVDQSDAPDAVANVTFRNRVLRLLVGVVI